MNKTQLAKFRKMFEEQKKSLLYHDKVIREDFTVADEEKFDEVDLASHDVEQSMRMRLRNRELLYFKKINEALDRIQDGSFGECVECGEEIELKRLYARPTATLCVQCKEEEERRETGSKSGREPKSLGSTIRELI